MPVWQGIWNLVTVTSQPIHCYVGCCSKTHIKAEMLLSDAWLSNQIMDPILILTVINDGQVLPERRTDKNSSGFFWRGHKRVPTSQSKIPIAYTYQSMEWTGSIRWIYNPVQSMRIWIGLDQIFTNPADSGLDWIDKCAMCIPYLEIWGSFSLSSLWRLRFYPQIFSYIHRRLFLHAYLHRIW